MKEQDMQEAKIGETGIGNSLISTDVKWLSTYILAFAIAFLVFVLGPPFLGFNFGPYPLMKVADIFDLFTPLILIPLYWLLFRLGKEYQPTISESLAFVILTAFWVLGHGIHLASNSIGHLIENMIGTDVYRLTSFYDEKLSHYLWHFGVIGLSAILIYRQWKNSLTEGIIRKGFIIAGGIVYGFTFFAMVIEGSTSPMGITFAVLALIFMLVWGRKNLGQHPLILLFIVSCGVSLILFAVWGIWQQGLPEFSEVGFI
jgi:hypothetical protein